MSDFGNVVVDEVESIVEACRPLLAGHHPAVQGAALADLLAIWLAGHPEGEREGLLAMHLSAVRQLVPVNAAILARRLARQGGVHG